MLCEKRFLGGMLGILLVLTLATACAQEPLAVLSDAEWVNPVSTAVVQNVYYALNQTDTGYELLVYEEDGEGLTPLLLPSEVGEPYDTVCLAEGAGSLLLISLSQCKAYDLSLPVAGQDAVTVSCVASWEQHQAFFDTDEFGDPYILSPVEAILCDQQLVMLFKCYPAGGEEQSTLVSVSLEDGTVAVLPVNDAAALAPYEETSFLFLQKDGKGQLNLMSYDLRQQRTAVVKQRLEEEEETPQLRYDAAQRKIFYLKGQRVMELGEDGEAVQAGYLDSPYVERMEILNTRAVIQTGGGFSWVSLDRSAGQATALTVYGGGSGELHRATAQLRETEPGLEVYRLNEYEDDTAESFINRILTNDDTADLYIMEATGTFLRIREKGYCMDLSSNERISAAVMDLHPQFRRVLCEGEKICAIPLSMFGWGWEVNTDVMEEMGLSLEEIPHSLEELCAFITRWNDEWCGEFPEYAPVEDWSDFRAALLDEMITAFLRESCAANQPVDFLSEDFARALAALEAMRCDRLDAMANGSEYRPGLLSDAHRIASCLASAQQPEKQFLPMSLLNGGTPILEARLSVMWVNPASGQADLALRFLEAVLATQDETERHLLYRSSTSPVANPDYQARKDELTQYLAEMEAALQQDTGTEIERLTWENECEWARMMLDQLSSDLISAEAITDYRQRILPELWLPAASGEDGLALMEKQDVQQCRKQYLDGRISARQFCQMLARIMTMRALED